MSEPFEELALFAPEQARPARAELPEDAWGALNVKWVKYKTKAPVCTHCIRLATAAGTVPQPLKAIWRRKTDMAEDSLCHAHAQVQREADTVAQNLSKARREINERAPVRKRREGSA